MFVPKILAIFVAMLIALPFMARRAAKPHGAARRPHHRRLSRSRQCRCTIDVSFLPALAAAFMLIFARIGTMVMLLPGLGELSVPPRVRLTIALVLTAVLLPLHRNAYQIDLRVVRPGADPARPGIADRRRARPDRAADDLGAAGRRQRSSPSSWASASSPRSIRRRASRACIVGNFLDACSASR